MFEESSCYVNLIQPSIKKFNFFAQKKNLSLQSANLKSHPPTSSMKISQENNRICEKKSTGNKTTENFTILI